MTRQSDSLVGISGVMILMLVKLMIVMVKSIIVSASSGISAAIAKLYLTPLLKLIADHASFLYVCILPDLPCLFVKQFSLVHAGNQEEIG